MSTASGDVCGGFSYEIVYLDGDLANIPSQEEINAVFSVSENTFTVTTTDLTWVGFHTIKIRGQNGDADVKLYDTIDSDEFTI